MPHLECRSCSHEPEMVERTVAFGTFYECPFCGNQVNLILD